MKALVTGATGFIGRFVCEELRRQGFLVRAALRRPAPFSGADEISVLGDLDERTEWSEALTGVSAVVHIAGRAHQKRKGEEEVQRLFAVNTHATAALAKAAAGRIDRFVFLSTVKVAGETSSKKPFVETDVPQPDGPYARSKWQAEIVLRETLAPSIISIIRTPLVYGPGVRANFLTLLRLVDRGVPLPFGSVTNRRSLIFVRNLASAIVTAAQNPQAAGETFYVSDDDDVSTAELIRRIADSLGKTPRLLPLPSRLITAAAALTGRRQTLEKLFGSLQVDIRHIKERLGWQPSFSMAEGLAETAAWYRL